MNIHQLQQEILELKKKTGTVILAHSYQAREIVEIADYTGDSYKLSVVASETDAENVLMCGVRFMAETVKILSPKKRVFLANSGAGCPMAEQLDTELLSQRKQAEPDRTVCAYINTTAELKTLCDVCVTSSSAVKIIKNIDSDKILFIPDCNLGDWVKKNVPQKDIKLVHGGCPTHAGITAKEVRKIKELHPNALFLVHPECTPEVVALADYVGSTSGIMDFAKNSNKKEFIIGTETSISEHLQYDCPDKRFFPVTKDIVCRNMKLTTLPDVYNALNGDMSVACEIVMNDELIAGARKCIDEMIRLGG